MNPLQYKQTRTDVKLYPFTFTLYLISWIDERSHFEFNLHIKFDFIIPLSLSRSWNGRNRGMFRIKTLKWRVA